MYSLAIAVYEIVKLLKKFRVSEYIELQKKEERRNLWCFQFINIIQAKDMKNIKIKNINYIKEYLKPYVGKLCIVIGLTFLGLSISLVQPFLFGVSIDWMSARRLEMVCICGGAILILEFVNGITNFFSGGLFAKIGMSMVYNIKTDFFNNMLELPVKKFDQLKNGEIINRYETDITSFAGVLTKTLVDSTMNILSTVIILAFLFKINYRMTIFLLIVFPVLIFIEKKFAQKIKKETGVIRRENDRYLSFFTEVLVGIKEVKSMVIENTCKKHMDNMQSKFVEHILKKNHISLCSEFIKSICWGLLNLAILLIGYQSISKGYFSLGGFISYTTYSVKFYMAIKEVINIYTKYCEVSVSIERVIELKENLSEKEGDGGNKISVTDIDKDIIFENVCFNYNDDYRVLNNFSISLKAKKCNLIVGNSGVGKTTIFQLLLKFYPLNKGHIYIGKENLDDINTKFWRKNIAYVSQTDYFLSDSIYVNICYVNDKLSEKDVELILKRVNLWNYICEMPNGMYSMMSEAGKNFSEGQKQRLSMAKAIAKNPRIFLLDEPTSSLDRENKKEIISIIKDMINISTVVIITHDQELIDALKQNSVIINMEEIYNEKKNQI